MTRKLADSDRAAVDLLFDQILSSADRSDGVVSMTSAVPEGNLKAVEKVLNLLSTMPAAEPPADLATRTLARIAGATGSALPIPGAIIEQDRPLA